MTWVEACVVVAAWAFSLLLPDLIPGYEKRGARCTAKRIAERERERGIYEV